MDPPRTGKLGVSVGLASDLGLWAHLLIEPRVMLCGGAVREAAGGSDVDACAMHARAVLGAQRHYM